MLNSARGESTIGNIPYVMGSTPGAHLTNPSPNQMNDPEAAADGIEERKFAREKVFNREERYRMLTYIFTHLKTDDHVSVSNIYE